MSIRWNNVKFSVNVDKFTTKQILDNLSGCVNINSITAIMGPSGAGKSSLLNILSGFQKNFSGKLTYNGDTNIEPYQNTIGFVHQSDLFKVNLTVYEHLWFIANLKNIKNIENKIESIMGDLKLLETKETQIKNLSGGEKKRLSIASELINDPFFLFLDEPTSGLDSSMAKSVINCLNNIKSDRIIILTIHQPSIYIYYSFDKIYLLKEGNLIYDNSPDVSYSYFESMGYSCPENENIAEYILEVISNNNIIVVGLQEYLNINKNAIIPINNENVNNSILLTLKKIRLLFDRNNRHFYRDKFLFQSQIFKNIFMIIIIGFLYFQLDNDENSIQSISGVMYFILINQAFNTLFPTIKAFTEDMDLFKRENKNLYTLFEYYFSKVNGDIIFQITTPLFLYTPIYFMIGLRNDFESFILSSSVIVLSCLAATSLGYLFGSLVTSIDMGLTLMSIVILPLMIGGGFFINSDSIPIYFIWLKYTSFFKYSFENLMIIEWKGKTIDCEDACYLSTGDEVLNFYNIDKDNFQLNYLILLLFSFFFRIITYFILKYKTHKMYN